MEKTKFFEENTVFIISSMVLVGLVAGMFYLKSITVSQDEHSSARPVSTSSPTATKTITSEETALTPKAKAVLSHTAKTATKTATTSAVVAAPQQQPAALTLPCPSRR